MRKILVSLATITAMFALAACSDTTSEPTTLAPSEPASSEPAEPTTEEPTAEEPEPTDDPTGIETTRIVSEGGRYAFELPVDYTVEVDVADRASDYWQNDEPTATYAIQDSSGLEVGGMSVNIETSSDGIPADYLEVVEVVPTVLLENGQVYARTTLSSLCWGESDAPEDECQFVYVMDVVSGGEGGDPEAYPGEPGALWVMEESPGDPAQGVVLFSVSVLGPNGQGFPFEEKDTMARSDEYAKAWKIIESFDVNG